MVARVLPRRLGGVLLPLLFSHSWVCCIAKHRHTMCHVLGSALSSWICCCFCAVRAWDYALSVDFTFAVSYSSRIISNVMHVSEVRLVVDCLSPFLT
jgi:hypothetical protein